MAVTSRLYANMLTKLGGSDQPLYYGQLTVVLLTADYNPGYLRHAYYADVAEFEVPANDSYTTGGSDLPQFDRDIESGIDFWRLTSGSVDFPALVATFRYGAVIGRNANSGNDQQLMFLIDFGETKTFNGEDFSIAFPDGVVTIKAATS